MPFETAIANSGKIYAFQNKLSKLPKIYKYLFRRLQQNQHTHLMSFANSYSFNISIFIYFSTYTSHYYSRFGHALISFISDDFIILIKVYG